MIDLTRLMFDDGASRPAIETSRAICEFALNGKRWRMFEIVASKDDIIEYGWSFWRAEDATHRESEFHILRFLEDLDRNPESMWGRHSTRPGDSHYLFDGDPLAFAVRFEEVL